jgi:hypothetical protein
MDLDRSGCSSSSLKNAEDQQFGLGMAFARIVRRKAP